MAKTKQVEIKIKWPAEIPSATAVLRLLAKMSDEKNISPTALERRNNQWKLQVGDESMTGSSIKEVHAKLVKFLVTKYWNNI